MVYIGLRHRVAAADTLALRRRITANEIAGPRILTSGEPFTARNYSLLHQADSTAGAARPEASVCSGTRALSAGADAIKLHAGAIVDRDRDLWVAIDVGLVQAVVAEAHASGKFVLTPAISTGCETPLTAASTCCCT